MTMPGGELATRNVSMGTLSRYVPGESDGGATFVHVELVAGIGGGTGTGTGTGGIGDGIGPGPGGGGGGAGAGPGAGCGVVAA